MKDDHKQLLEKMTPGQWYYTLGMFEDDLQSLVNLGYLKKKEGVIGPAYMKPKTTNKALDAEPA